VMLLMMMRRMYSLIATLKDIDYYPTVVKVK
jgi:hypothetical protein